MRNGDVSTFLYSVATLRLQSASLLRSIHHASRAQGKLPLRRSGFRGPVEHASAISALPVFHLPKGGRCWWIDQPRSARAHTPDHQGERKHLVSVNFHFLFWLGLMAFMSRSLPRGCTCLWRIGYTKPCQIGARRRKRGRRRNGTFVRNVRRCSGYGTRPGASHFPWR